jgi:hypothetical protein
VAISYRQLHSRLIWEPRYIAAARTRITGNTSCDHYFCVMSPWITENTCHVLPTYCCVTSPCMRCIAMVHVWTQRKHFHSIVEWRMYWNMFTGLLPSNALSKSVTICLSHMQFVTFHDVIRLSTPHPNPMPGITPFLLSAITSLMCYWSFGVLFMTISIEASVFKRKLCVIY